MSASSVTGGALRGGALRLRRTNFVLRMPSVAVVGVVVTLPLACDHAPPSHAAVRAVFGGVGGGPGDFAYPRAIAVDRQGRMYVVDKSARIQRFGPDCVFQTEWRMPQWEGGKPVGLAVHPDGRVFVADTHYSRVMVFTADGEELASFGRAGFGDGELQLPTDVAFDRDGFVYVAEYGGNDRITKWTPDLAFHCVFQDGDIDGVGLRRPAGLAFDGDGTLWVADACNHRVVGLDPAGRVTAVFGRMGGEPGQLRYPYDIDVTADGRLVVCEYGNSRLQWFERDGTPAGTWGAQGREVGCLWAPWGAAVAPDGAICVVDSLNSRIQVLTP